MEWNPFEGGWGFLKKPFNEEDKGFDIFRKADPNEVLVRFKPSGDEADGVIVNGELEFTHDLGGGKTIRYYRGVIVHKDPPDCYATDCRFSLITGRSVNSEVGLADDDWVGNRPA